MTTWALQYYTRTELSCAGSDDPSVLVCLSDPSLVNQPNYRCAGYTALIEGRICQYAVLDDSCNPLRLYTIEYDTDQLVTPNTQITATQVLGAFCLDCLTDTLTDILGDVSSLFSDEENTISLRTAHGCTYKVQGAVGIGTLGTQFLYGDGADGDLIVHTGEELDLPAAKTHTFQNVTVEVGGILHLTAPISSAYLPDQKEVYPLYVSDTLTVQGTILFDGADAPNDGSGNPGLSSNAQSSIADGPGGGTDDGGYGGAPGDDGSPNGGYRAGVYYMGGGHGGTGGNGGSTGGGVGFDVSSVVPGIGYYETYSLPYAVDRLLIPGLFEIGNQTNYICNAIGGGSGGGGGGGGGHTGSGTGGHGGGGGAPGGSICIAAKNIVIDEAGLISAKGGSGGKGSDGIAGAPGDEAAGGAGGGGGGGGLVYLLYDSLVNSGTIDVSGGAGGVAGASIGAGVSSQDGAAGADGTIISLNLKTGVFS